MMTRRETRITNVIRSRGVAVLLMLLGVWMAWHAPGIDLTLPLQGGALMLTLATGGLMIAINRHFNLLRTSSMFFAALFVVATCATPGIFDTGIIPPLLALVVTAAMGLMFSLYNQRRSDRRIFLVFTLLSAGALADIVFLLYVPVFLAGIAQMRIFRFKKIVAAVMGLVTPWWIAWGLGLMTLPRLPHIFFTPPSMLAGLPVGWPFIVAVGLTLLTGFFTGVLNLIRIIGFNAKSRALNGLLSLVSIVTGTLCVINFTALPTYVVLLNACVAFQVGHFFRATANSRGYIFVLALLASYIGLFIWNIIRLG